MRRGEVIAQAGYDGEYGVIRVFGGRAEQASAPQLGLFAETDEKRDADDAENAESADTPASSDLSASSAPVRVYPRPVSEANTTTIPIHEIASAYEAPPSRITRHASRPASTTNSAPPSSAPTRRWSSSPGRARAKRAR